MREGRPAPDVLKRSMSELFPRPWGLFPGWRFPRSYPSGRAGSHFSIDRFNYVLKFYDGILGVKVELGKMDIRLIFFQEICFTISWKNRFHSRPVKGL
jgi:hypothetical protein